MYLIYIDESGTTNLSDHRNYILAAVLVHERKWENLNNKIQEMKNRLFKNSEIEFHTSHIVQRIKDFENLEYRKSREILTSMADIIASNRCMLISVIINKSKIQDKDKEWVQEWAWRLLLERIELFLRTRNLKSQSNYGLLCVDNNNEKITDHIKGIIHNFRIQGTMFVNSKYIIEDPFFVDSAMRNMVQMSDFVAWVVKQWYSIQNGNKEFSKINRKIFDTIKHRFDNIDGSFLGSGIKIHPE